MLVLGIVLLVLALHFLFWVGVVLLIVGAVLAVAGHAGHSVGGRSHWY